jgi:chaperonin GroES
MNLQPLTDHLIVRPLKQEKTQSGIVVPEEAKEKPETGEVLAVGPGRILDNGSRLPMTVKAGDKILFRKYAPDEFKNDGETLLILSESDILAVII